ncbi:MAG: hypothetical protein JWR10_1341 [Rubritepida sp.]|nr:hypothetical protein [Rubritepida sp.]
MSARLNSLPSAPRLPATLDGPMGGFHWLEHLMRFWRAYDTRTRLAELDEHMLRDIGVSPEQARREANRPPWDIQGC